MDSSRPSRPWLYDLAFVLILLVGAYFRFIGINWDQNQHLHPDERFLTMVESSLQPVDSISAYFDTDNSTLNPHNRGYGFFVYGTLPIFIVRYAGEWVGMTGYDDINLVGRAASALADLGAVFLLYLVASRLYGRKVGLLSAAFSAFAVMQIQQSHFFTVDNFVTFFAMLSCYFAIEIMLDDGEAQISFRDAGSVLRSGLFLNTVGFGLALGMSVASKLNAAPLAALLPVAFIIRYFRVGSGDLALGADYSDTPDAQQPEAEIPAELESRPFSQARSVEFAMFLVVVGALMSILAFRIFQPYAFAGPGFFGVMPNDKWVQNIAEQRAQAGGDVDFPPALQWARRSKLFGLENMVIWGLGWPLGVLAVAGFGYMVWKMLQGEWKTHLLLWSWTAGYFAWQSTQFNPNMRYFLPVYPLFAMMAAWLVFEIGKLGVKKLQDQESRGESTNPAPRSLFTSSTFQVTSWIIGALVLALTLSWAFAFTRIYTRDHTRVQATDWIYQNIPGPITVNLTDGSGAAVNQPISFPYGMAVTPQSPFQANFRSSVDGKLSSITLPLVRSVSSEQKLTVTISTQPGGVDPLAQANLSGNFGVVTDSPRVFSFDQQVGLVPGQLYYLDIVVQEAGAPVDVCGRITLQLLGANGATEFPVDFPACQLYPGAQVEATFQSPEGGTVTATSFEKIFSPTGQSDSTTLTVSVSDITGASGQTVSAAQTDSFAPTNDPRGNSYVFKFDPPLEVVKDGSYSVQLAVQGGPLQINHIGPVNESSWDDGLPLRMNGYDGYGGIYQGDLNFEMYWDDNTDKYNRFVNNLDAGDYIFISSNRQWATTVRVPERYPLTTAYYRNLIGCPEDKDIIWCYNVAKPGQFTGHLGYELVQVFESYPTLGPLQFNDQFAEEAFTVYDHTKVLIFKKSPNYDPQQVRDILGAVDLSHVIHLTPLKSNSYPGDLTLSTAQLAIQRAGGTWSQLFSYESLQNRYPVLGLIIWYLAIGLLGFAAYPLTRFFLPGLSDKGYPLARLIGLLLLAYFAWIVASLGGEYSRMVIAAGYGLIVLAGAVTAWIKRDEIRAEIQSKGRYYLLIEALFLALFLIDLFIRIGNPDLWHPSKGGERPMDFSYLNAVIKSTTFPPYDPWYAGGYINYYYWGFVLVGTPIKLLGIVPSIAYNFVLPTLFAMLGIGGFSVAWNLIAAVSPRDSDRSEFTSQKSFNLQLISGIAASAGLVLLGNLGTIRAVFRALQKLAVKYEMVDGTSAYIYERWIWAGQGLLKLFKGEPLPLGMGEWYWQPSRVIPAPGEVEPITEFPLFTFLYSDLHAHMIALPLAVLAVAWVLSTLCARNLTRSNWLATLAFGGLVIGALRPTNTWDFPTYLALAAIVTIYAVFRYVDVGDKPRFGLSPFIQRIALALAAAAALTLFSLAFFQPFARWYGLGYSQVEQWKGTKTPIWSYWTHWGLFLFVIISWMTWETRQWMAQTPVSALAKLKPYEFLIELAFAGLAAAVLALTFMFDVSIAWFALPLAFWALLLLLRPDQPDAKRLVLFMIGTGLTLTLVVEVIVLVGDISRMNTVFKFYLQVWVLFAMSAAAGLGWILSEIDQWKDGWRNFWEVTGSLFLVGALAFTVTATMDKIRDRMTPDAVPLTLDSMEYMKYATYWDQQPMTLSQDYNAIRWLQENVQGSPVIVEASIPEYRWGTRMTIYTGLPGVLGWNWHQRQQRALLPNEWIFQRSDEIKNFYITTDEQAARDFLKKYSVKYIILGQNEEIYFPGAGLDKFPNLSGILWNQVFRDGNTAIYEVIGAQ